MSETLYTYVRVRRPDGSQGYDRVPLHQAESYPGRVVEELVAMPAPNKTYKNGEFPGMGSVVVDSLLAKTEAAAAKRALRDAQDDRAEAERIRAQLGGTKKPTEPQKAARAYGRVLEP
jgi:hypothetical protein